MASPKRREPRQRRPPSRLDPSPECVALWNDTRSRKGPSASRKRARPSSCLGIVLASANDLLVDRDASTSDTTDREELESECDDYDDGHFTPPLPSGCNGGGGGGGASSASSLPPPVAADAPRAALPVSTARNVVFLKLPRCKMPYRWAEPLPPFRSCLSELTEAEPAASGLPELVLRGALSGDEVAEQSWLTSAFIDIVMRKFARTYSSTTFMPIEFAAYSLRDGSTREDMAAARDILGRPVDYAEGKPFVLPFIQNNHWQLLRVQLDPVPELQLFEPMGKPAKRGGGGGGISARYIPKQVFRWLNAMYPLGEDGVAAADGWPYAASTSAAAAAGAFPSAAAAAAAASAAASAAGVGEGGGGWMRRSFSAVTRQQQQTGFDCGVASLLYAEKCGQGQLREDIDEYTTQGDLTLYRRLLRDYSESLHSGSHAAAAAAAAVSAAPV